MDVVRWGIVSAGNIANTFASDIRHVAGARAHAVAARDRASALAFAGKHGIKNAYGGYDELFADPDIDAIYVATPHTFHFEHSSTALAAGKAVLCEKPIATSAAECRRLLDVARRANAYLMEAMWTWFLPATIRARQWVDAGRIGKLCHIKADFGFRLPYRPDARQYDASLAGGCLLDIGIYPVAIARYFTGEAPAHVDAVSRHAPNGVDDDVAMLFAYPDFAASLAASFRCKLPNSAFIVGSDGYIHIPDFWRARECLLFAGRQKADTFADDRQGSGFEFQIAAVSNDVVNGAMESDVVTHAASLALQEDMDRVRATF